MSDEPVLAVEGEEMLKQAVETWRKAQIVHESPSWKGFPKARASAEAIALHRRFDPSLWELLSDPHPLVAAYSLMTLELMGSDLLANLPKAILSSRSNLTFQLGSFRNAMDLGGFARLIQKRSRERNSRRMKTGSD